MDTIKNFFEISIILIGFQCSFTPFIKVLDYLIRLGECRKHKNKLILKFHNQIALVKSDNLGQVRQVN